jgi:hypothetical protein
MMKIVKLNKNLWNVFRNFVLYQQVGREQNQRTCYLRSDEHSSPKDNHNAYKDLSIIAASLCAKIPGGALADGGNGSHSDGGFFISHPGQ